MATLLGDAYIRVRPDTKGFESETKGRFGGIGRKAGVAFAGAFAAIGVTKVIGSVISEANNLGESVNAVNVVFGDAAEGVKALGENAARSVGMSNTEFNGLAVRFSSFVQTIVGEGGDVVGTLDDLTKRSADFASVMNIDVPEAAGLFQSALAGESEPLRKYGIDVSAAAVETYAYANGITEAGASMTEQEKVQARYGLIMEQTNDTTGDFANTSDGLANSQRILSAEWSNLKAKAGTVLLPMLAGIATAVGEKVLPAIEKFGGYLADKLGPHMGTIGDTAKGLGEFFTGTLVPAVTDVAKWLGENLYDAFTQIYDAVVDNKDKFSEYWEVLKGVAVYIAEEVLPIVKKVVEEGLDVFSDAVAWLVDNMEWLEDILVPMTAAIGAYKAVMILATAATKAQAAWTGTMTAAQWLLNAALSANPIGLVIAVLAALVAGIILAWKESETFRTVVVTALNATKDAVAMAVDSIVGFFSDFAIGILETAAEVASALGMDGLAAKLDTAAEGVRGFKEDVNREMAAIKDKDIKLDVRANGSWGISEARIANEHQARRPGNYAVGGAVHGPGTGTSDSIPAWLSNNEHVWTAKEVQNAGGHAAVEALRNQFRYAKGGAVHVNGLDAKKVYGVAKANYDPTESALLNAIAKKSHANIQAATALSGAGFGKTGGWPPRRYWQVAENTAAAAAFVRNKWGVNVGTLGARGNKSDHPWGKALDAMIPNWNQASGKALGNQIASYFVNNPGAFGTKYVIWDKKINKGSGWRPYQHPSGQSNPTLDHRDHPHVSLYDRGGVLGHGSVGVNRSGKPEAVLTNDQWKTLEKVANGGGTPSELVIVDVNGDLIGRMRTEALDATGLGTVRQTTRSHRR